MMVEIEKEDGTTETRGYVIEGVYLAKILSRLKKLKNVDIAGVKSKRDRYMQGYVMGIETAIDLVLAITGLPEPK